ncbi:polysaccharide biosynthesis tyrosine autokinase [Calothrix membranacea FACHB-236]|nr:polysaccharide biosynthesis tyrosine autokinase [Calothrix membranacea FACHB-236]
MAGILMGKAAFPLSSASAIKRHSWAAALTFVSVLVSVTAISFAISPRLYETSIRLLVGQKEVGLSSLGQALTDINNRAPSKAADPVATQAELVKSPQVLRSALKKFQKNSEIPAEKLPTIEQLQQAIKVEILPATNILQISYQNPYPKVAADLLNEVSKLVMVENTKLIRTEASSVRKFLEEQIAQQQIKFKQAEIAERKYRETYSLVASETQTQGLIESLTALENQERQLRAQLQEARNKDQSLQQVVGVNDSQGAYLAGRVGQDEQLKELQKQLTSVEIALTDARFRWTDEHPNVLALLHKRDELRSLYNQQLSQIVPENQAVASSQVASNQLSQDLMSLYITSHIERQGLENKLTVVRSDIERLRSRVARIPSSQQALVSLTREREKADKALKALEDKLEEARIAEGQILSNIRIIGQAEIPSDPVSPRPLVIVVLSTVIAIIAAGAMVLILELMASTLRDTSEVEAWLETPVIGILPKFSPATSNLADLNNLLDTSDHVEPYRMLLKTLESAGKESAKVIVISSVSGGEGKSSVALHLAAVAGILSRRTLIINADFRYPMYESLLNLPASLGLTEVIADNVPWQDAVQQTAIPNLSLLGSGKIPDRPSMIIETDAMAKLLAEAAKHYDYVIVDSSPVKNSADAATLSQFSDGLLLVVKPNSTSRDAAMQAISNLQKSGTAVLGVVMNETVLPLEKAPPLLASAVERKQLAASEHSPSWSMVKETGKHTG